MALKVVNLNLWYGGMLFDAIIDFLKAEEPDILCVQEVYNNPTLKGRFNTVSELQQLLGYKNVSFAPTFTHTTDGEGQLLVGNAIFSKFPIVKTKKMFFMGEFKEVVLENPELSPFIPRSLQWAQIKTPKKTLNVFNTHGIWGKDGLDNPERLKMAEFIIKAVKNKENVILCGDFNVNEGTRTITNIGQVLYNVFENDKRVTSFNMEHKPKDSGYSIAVVDFIFTSKNLEIVEKKMPEVNISDHLPLIVAIKS